MKVGDMVIRKVLHTFELSRRAAMNQRELLGHGIVLTKQMAGSNPVHPCVTVYYPKVQKTYDIAESLLEVISENR